MALNFSVAFVNPIKVRMTETHKTYSSTHLTHYFSSFFNLHHPKKIDKRRKVPLVVPRIF